MKKLFLLALVTLTAFSLSGCLVFHAQNTINGDGSGTAELSMSISPSVAEALTELKELDPDQAKDMDFPDLEDIDRKSLEKAAKGHGVRVKKFEKELVDGRQVLNIILDFEDLKGFSYVMGRLMSSDGGSNAGLGIFDAGDGNFVLRTTTYDFPAEPATETETPEEDEADSTGDAAEMDPEMMQKQMAIMGKLMGAMAELDVSFKITVPGDLVSTNAPETEGRTSIWAVNSSNMMTMDKNMDPEIVFSGQGLNIKPIKE